MEPNQVDVTQAYMRARAIPIYSGDSHTKALVGCASLFTANARFFLITARHILTGSDTRTWLIPDGRFRGNFKPIGELAVHTESAENPDVAIIELLSPRAINVLKDGWQFLTVNNLALATTNDIFSVLLGYPLVLTTQEGQKMKGAAIALHAKRLSQPPAQAPNVDLGYDLFYEHQSTALQQRDGVEVRNPELQGTSGCAVWEIQKQPPHYVWAPENTAKVVGVQSAYMYGRYFRAVSWTAVGMLFRQVAPKIAEEIQRQLTASAPTSSPQL